jgi:Tfp pilus assembly protein PilP
MKRLQPFSKFAAVFALLLWCASLSGAQQVRRTQAKPQASKAPAAKTNATKPSAGMQAIPKHAAKPMAKEHVRPEAKGARSKSAETRVRPARPLPATVEAAPQTPSVVAPLPPPPPVAVEEAMHTRDPFAPLVRASEPDAGHANLPPGIAGLQVATMRLEGMVKTSDGIMAVVANPDDHVYFLHSGDHIFDGVVEKIELAQITFQQESKDAFGRVVQREVTKRLYPIAGDEQ